MKFLIFFALAFDTVSPKHLYSRLIEDPVLENEGRIINGKKADQEQFKYQVGLNMKKSSSLAWCAGSLIAEEWVLTVAHCGVDATSAMVFLGATKRECPEKTYDVPGRNIFSHPLWEPSILKNDICVIQIPATIESSRIGFVKIPKNNEHNYLHQSVIVSGWGRTIDHVPGPVDDLHYAILKVSPGSLCFEHYGLFFSNDNRLCVGTPDKVSACHGDSGDPLVLEGTNLQIGAFSVGNDVSCIIETPLIFTHVGAYRLWIWLRTGIKT